ncbi:AraC family transcriptional regulator [Spirosoma sp. 209]|uniref:helix-turn-helix transcriptional regulator n=1 Tax=Spirosoma sp. 209 TaxID=1955701 RepID=UPI00098CF96E|nr:AraC family transcriptional regulator [Spirosoma sp. 209]
MNALRNGQYYGLTNQLVTLGGLTLTDTEYTHDRVDWHYHENAYFTFVLAGRVLEGNRTDTHHCTAGSLLFHHWQEAHYNTKPRGYTRGFHVEITPDWFNAHGLDTSRVQGSLNLPDPGLKALMYAILKETKLQDGHEKLAVDALLVQLLSEIESSPVRLDRQKPAWVSQLRDLLHDAPHEPWTLAQLADQTGLHPVYLCRQFPRYFHCHFGGYLRAIRLQQAMPLLLMPDIALTDVALACGFSDQSHFIRSFRQQYRLTPSHYRKLLAC